MRLRKTNENEPLMTRRKKFEDIETGIGVIFQDKSTGWPDSCVGGVRRGGGVSLS